jgi:polyisoprenoid-binding protein YceI
MRTRRSAESIGSIARDFPKRYFIRATSAQTGDNGYLVRGTLTVKGVERQIEVPAVCTNEADTATITGEFTLKRLTFRIGLGEWAATDVVAPDLAVKFSVKLRPAS